MQTFTSSTLGATIHYTIDNSEPSVDSMSAPSTLLIGESTIVRAIAVKEGCITSDEAIVRRFYLGSMATLFVESGYFDMGGTFDDSSPSHEVHIGSFYMGKYEVTQGEYFLVMGARSSGNSPEKGWENLSVEGEERIIFFLILVAGMWMRWLGIMGIVIRLLKLWGLRRLTIWGFLI